MNYEVRVPFPQADDFEKVVSIVNIEDENKIKDVGYMSVYLEGISERQVSYYINAAIYLGLLDKNKNFTELGEEIRNQNSVMQVASLIRVLMQDRVIGMAYILGKMMNRKLEREDIAQMIYKEYPEYCEEIYKRRAQTVISWTSWIEEKGKEE